MGAKMSVLRQIMSFCPYLRSAMLQLPLLYHSNKVKFLFLQVTMLQVQEFTTLCQNCFSLNWSLGRFSIWGAMSAKSHTILSIVLKVLLIPFTNALGKMILVSDFPIFGSETVKNWPTEKRWSFGWKSSTNYIFNGKGGLYRSASASVCVSLCMLLSWS